MKTVLIAAVAMMSLLSLCDAQAEGRRGTNSPGVNARQQQQQVRVREGVASGDLTRREAQGLRHEQRDIRQLEREYKSDGTLTKSERSDLHREMNQSSRHIYNQKHDGQERPNGAAPIRDPGVNARQHNQGARIVNGVKTGEITKDEAQTLRQDQRDVRQTEREYKSDGVLTRDERQDLHQDLNRTSQGIRAEKHDDEQR